QVVLKVKPGVKVAAYGVRVAFSESVVEALVVRVVEALLLERPFEVPVDLGHERETRVRVVYRRGGTRPERLRRDAPSPGENFRQFEHRHIAPDAVALRADPLQLAKHRVLQRGIAVIQLERVGPTGEVWIPTISQDPLASKAVNAPPVLGLGGQLFGSAFGEEISTLVERRVIL